MLSFENQVNYIHYNPTKHGLVEGYGWCWIWSVKTLITLRCIKATLADIAGQDIHSHDLDINILIKQVRNWLSHHPIVDKIIPGGKKIASKYKAFQEALPRMCENEEISEEELTLNDYSKLISMWLSLNG